MSNIYWIGGSPCAGKTTISEIIGQEFGWQVYHIDRHIESYLKRADEYKHPNLSYYRKIGLRNFLLLDAETQLESVIGMSHEQFAFILEDIAELDDNRPILVEGANLLATDILNQGASAQHCQWMIPTQTFQLEVYPKRGSWVQDVLRHHFEPDEAIIAFENWMERDAMMATWTANEAHRLNINVITVDGSISLLDNAETVMHHFGLLQD